MVVRVDFDRVTKSCVNRGAAGINLCWLLDSDLNRKQPAPMVQALADLGVGTLRFPYGHLADNYLWHTPPYGGIQGGLRPKVASSEEVPGDWTWAVKPDRSMPAGMDFDEYLALCDRLGARPLVCVNVLSFKYPGGPTYEELKASAVAWVKYAKTRSPKVAYWEIGNEVEHKENGKLLPLREYVALYEDFARAMKQADPAAQIGPGILKSPAYYRAIVHQCQGLVDFASVHQYMWSWQKACSDFAGWRDCTDTFITNIEEASRVLAEAGLHGPRLLVTETGVTGGTGIGQVNNTYKALWCFEVLMNQLSHPGVAYAYYWGTHTPWNFQGDDAEPANDAGLALRHLTNSRTPTGEVLRLINGELLDAFTATERVQGRLRCYTMRSGDGHRRVLLLLNKDDLATSVEIPLDGKNPAIITQCREFSGLNPGDVSPVFRDRPQPQITDGTARLTLSPLSITVLRFGE